MHMRISILRCDGSAGPATLDVRRAASWADLPVGDFAAPAAPGAGVRLLTSAAFPPAAPREACRGLALAERAQAQGRIAREGDWQELAGGARALSDGYWARQRKLADAVARARAACGQVPFPRIRRDAGAP